METPRAIAQPLPDELVELIAGRFSALADPTRIRLLDRLTSGEATVGELCDAVGTTRQNVSKQMLLLLAAGLVRRRRQGNFVYYRVAGPEVTELCATVCASLRATAGAVLAAAS
ncbi:MAG TPA: metalloregulator ArsR/SmtB family transcription factor [Gaiellaceae bacterium]|nr:metalloregulator ArsR/SmtB family transcription factor [Gaiellaceae bacterium]